MKASRSYVLAWVADLSASLVTDAVDLDAVADRIDAAQGLTANEFAAEMIDLVRISAESVSGVAGFGRFVVPADVTAADRPAFAVLVAVGLAIAGPRIGWPSRPAARAARSTIADAVDEALAVASSLGASGADLYAWIDGLASVAIRIVSDQAASAVPMVRVETGISLPSTVIAWHLYGDPGRAEALVDAARSLTPMLMPATFEALES